MIGTVGVFSPHEILCHSRLKVIINEVLAILESLDFHHLFYTQLLGSYHPNKFNNSVVVCMEFTIWI